MAVKDLEARQGNVNLTLEVVDKGEMREFEKFGKQGRVCNATAKDESGSITITLWNDDIDKVNVGDTIKIENGWVSEWQGELQLSTGKFGKLEIVDGKEGAKTEDEKVEADDLASSETDSEEKVLSEDEKVEEESLEELKDEPAAEEEISKDEKEETI